MFRSLPLCLVCLICVALVGCKNKVSPSGKVTRDGKDFTLSKNGMFIISFFAEADKEMKNPLQAETKPDGTFTLIGKDRKGVPPGKYRASVQAFDPYGGPDKKDVLVKSVFRLLSPDKHVFEMFDEDKGLKTMEITYTRQ